MPSFRCTICNENWPNTGPCPQCTGDTWYQKDVDPTKTSSEQARAVARRNTSQPEPDDPTPAGTQQTTDEVLRAHRVERYLTLGFDEEDAALLADATESEVDKQGRTWTRALNWQRVAQALDAGCSHLRAVLIFA